MPAAVGDLFAMPIPRPRRCQFRTSPYGIAHEDAVLGIPHGRVIPESVGGGWGRRAAIDLQEGASSRRAVRGFLRARESWTLQS